MSLEICVLASGSSGNCTVVRSPGGVMLIDAGIGPRLVAQRITELNICARTISAVCLTHLDRDHFNTNWFGTLARRGIVVHCHASKEETVRRLASDAGASIQVEPFDRAPFEPLAGVSLKPIALAHDAEGSHGFLMEGFGGRVGYATDLGRVPEELIEHFGDGLDVMAIESNYDQRMQIDSPRPWFLKQRIMGGNGHLSNEQAFDAVRRVLRRCESNGKPLPAHIVLLHRSGQCNCPDLLRNLFSRDARIAPRLVLAEQHAPTGWLRASRAKPLVGDQLTLAFA